MSVLSAAGSRSGFTVLEVVVALFVSAVTLLGGRLLVEALGRSAVDIRQATAVEARSANADRLLRALVGRLEIGTPGASGFSGSQQDVHFTTWCDTPGGWLEECQALLAFGTTSRRSQLVAQLIPIEANADIGPRSIVIKEDFRHGEFRYLNDPGSGGHWFLGWGESVTTPAAIGIIIDDDTTIARIGGRG